MVKIGFSCPSPKVWTLYSKEEDMGIILNVTLTFCFTEKSLKITWKKVIIPRLANRLSMIKSK